MGKQWGTLILNGRNGDSGLLGSIPNVVEEDVTIIDEVESIAGRCTGLSGNGTISQSMIRSLG